MGVDVRNVLIPDVQEIKGYELCPARTVGFTILCAVTLCLPLVLISWKTEIKVQKSLGFTRFADLHTFIS